MEWTQSLVLHVAPPEYVILRKLEFFREGGATKHTTDIRAILGVTAVDTTEMDRWAERLGLEELWSKTRSP